MPARLCRTSMPSGRAARGRRAGRLYPEHRDRRDARELGTWFHHFMEPGLRGRMIEAFTRSSATPSIPTPPVQPQDWTIEKARVVPRRVRRTSMRGSRRPASTPAHPSARRPMSAVNSTPANRDDDELQGRLPVGRQCLPDRRGAQRDPRQHAGPVRRCPFNQRGGGDDRGGGAAALADAASSPPAQAATAPWLERHRAAAAPGERPARFAPRRQRRSTDGTPVPDGQQIG